MAQFDALGDIYDDFAQTAFRRHLELPSIVRALGDVTGLHALDLGCGTGPHSRTLARLGAEGVVGADVAEGMLEHARQAEREHPLGVRYERAPLTDGFAGRFDLVLSVYVMPYAADRDQLDTLCAQAFAALKPGGRLVALPANPDLSTVPGYYRPYGFDLAVPEPLADGSRITLLMGEEQIAARYWTRDALDQALTRAGFTAVRGLGHHVSPEGEREFGPGFWRDYLDRPHALILEARRPAQG
ncbi:class I SAM-dependent methyltransferase [Nocardiopsis sp. SBT366]|uniref:class I SAM-dependent methyltransferase n=1 Tax=Nocardiopsis sp. SBT366 TaxID=1580529 RepID=UPI00066C250D|nr:class I SAM-dependent methyltransferase [Nocardiopsis sp. SBT366]